MYAQWESEEIFFSSDEFFDSLLSGLDAAKSSICLETYIFEKDGIGIKIEETLIRAAKRGVQVRLVVDGIGSYSWLSTLQPILETSGVKVKVYHPLVWSISRSISALNRRNHRKVCIVDNEIAWVGSQNMTQVHSEKLMGVNSWHDLAAKLTGAEIRLLSIAFDNVWNRSHSTDGRRDWISGLRPKRLKIENLVRLNFTRRLRKNTRRDLIQRLKRAEKRVWFINPYFAPSYLLLRHLAKAQKRGVDVRVLVPEKNDVFFMRWVASSFYGFLIENKIRIFEYKPRFLHAKSVCIDDWVTIGTSNMNTRSLVHDLEVDVIISHIDNKVKLEEHFLLALQNSNEITRDSLSNYHFSRILGRVITFLFHNWI